jgi:hypothetical protein
MCAGRALSGKVGGNEKRLWTRCDHSVGQNGDGERVRVLPDYFTFARRRGCPDRLSSVQETLLLLANDHHPRANPFWESDKR